MGGYSCMAVSCRMSAPRRFMLIMVVASCLASGFARVDVIQAVENPHMQDREASEGGKCSADGSTSCVQSCPQQGALDAAMILTDAIMTQPDTLLRIERKKYMGMEVPIYFFKQPNRLNPQELPFRIIRTRHVDTTGLVFVPVDPQFSHDSWFPLYKWDVLVCVMCDKMMHLGWRFSPKEAGTGEVFYALIVDYAENQRSAEAAAERGLLEQLTVGVRAPAWLVALASTSLGAQMKK